MELDHSFNESSEYPTARPLYVDSIDGRPQPFTRTNTAEAPSDAFRTARSAGTATTALSPRQPLVPRLKLPPRTPRKPDSSKSNSIDLSASTSGAVFRESSGAFSPLPPPPLPPPPAGGPRRSSARLGQGVSPRLPTVPRTRTDASSNDKKADASAPPLTEGEEEEGKAKGGWWEALRGAAISQAAWVGYYLDSVVDPAAARRPDTEEPPPPPAQPQQQQQQGQGDDGFGGLFHDEAEPSHEPAGEGDRRGGAGVLQRVVLDPDQAAARRGMLPVVQMASRDVEAELLDAAESGSEDSMPSFEVDLVSALRSYRIDPSDVFGHLVAAALNPRSLEDHPVTGAELEEARRHPFLVRMIVESGKLKLDDPLVQTEVQETVNLLAILDYDYSLSPAVYAYLAPLLFLPFVRLSQQQYKLLKNSGYEYVTLLHACPHVLPPGRLHSVLLLHSRAAYILHAVCLTLQLLVNTLATVSCLLVLALWFTRADTYSNLGYYTLIVYGCGYALNLITMIFLTRARADETVYEPRRSISMPSAYSFVVPSLPIFDALCLVSYLRAWRAGHLILCHNIVASSCLSGACFAVLYGFPQWITQCFFNRVLNDVARKYRNMWTFSLLEVVVICQFLFSLLRMCYLHLFFTSTDGVGYARFNTRHSRSHMHYHRGVPLLLHYLAVFVLFSNIYLVVACAYVGDYGCNAQKVVIISIAGVTCFVAVVMIACLFFANRFSRHFSVVHTSFLALPIAAFQVVILVLFHADLSASCAAYRDRILRKSFIFGYLTWAVAGLCFVAWLVVLVLWALRGCCGVSLFPRLTCPAARSCTDFPVLEAPAGAGGAAGEGGVSEADWDDDESDGENNIVFVRGSTEAEGEGEDVSSSSEDLREL